MAQKFHVGKKKKWDNIACVLPILMSRPKPTIQKGPAPFSQWHHSSRVTWRASCSLLKRWLLCVRCWERAALVPTFEASASSRKLRYLFTKPRETTQWYKWSISILTWDVSWNCRHTAPVNTLGCESASSNSLLRLLLFCGGFPKRSKSVFVPSVVS